MVASHLWHPWPGRCWPLLSDEERSLVQSLRELDAPPQPSAERGDLTIILDTIRTGVDLSYVKDLLPGLELARLLVAYEKLDVLRLGALDAWDTFKNTPTHDSLQTLGPKFEPLFPLPLSRLLKALVRGGESAMEDQLAFIISEMTKITHKAQEIEALLKLIEPPSDQGVELGRFLYDPYTPGLWGSPYYRPSRVGSLIPVRVRALLGESRV